MAASASGNDDRREGTTLGTVDEPPAEGGESEPPASGDVDAEVAALIREALEHFAAAEEALRNGDLGTYQSETAKAEELLRQADRILRGLPPEPAEGEPTDAPSEMPTDAAPETQPAPTEPATPASPS